MCRNQDTAEKLSSEERLALKYPQEAFAESLSSYVASCSRAQRAHARWHGGRVALFVFWLRLLGAWRTARKNSQVYPRPQVYPKKKEGERGRKEKEKRKKREKEKEIARLLAELPCLYRSRSRSTSTLTNTAFRFKTEFLQYLTSIFTASRSRKNAGQYLFKVSRSILD